MIDKKVLKRNIPILEALCAGKVIQFKHPQETCNTWKDYKEIGFGYPAFFEEYYEWRIKPEPKLRPWKPEEVPVGAIIKTDSKLPTLILSVFKDKNDCLGHCFSFADYNKYEDKLDINYVFLTDAITSYDNYKCSTDNGKTWHPCGIMEE